MCLVLLASSAVNTKLTDNLEIRYKGITVSGSKRTFFQRPEYESSPLPAWLRLVVFVSAQ